MKDAIESRRHAFFAKLRERGLTIAALSRLSGIPATTLYSYRDGKGQSLTGINQEKIASALQSTVDDLFREVAHSVREVGVWGKIGARAEVYPLSDYASTPMYEVALPATLDPSEEYVAFEIEGFSMPPAEPGWVVLFRKVEALPEDLINSPVLVDTKDGRRLFKRLRRGYSDGLWNLESWDGSPLIENVEITTVLPFAALTPGRKAR
jgi:lambda repressor-like predicted transcriptional regulator